MSAPNNIFSLALLISLSFFITACGGGGGTTGGGTTGGGGTTTTQISILDSNTLSPLTSAVVVVDGTEYRTNANGKVSIPGITTGTHELHVFSNGYDWISILDYTANSNTNRFTLTKTSLASQQYGAATIDATLPNPLIMPTYGYLSMNFVDSYGNTTPSQGYSTASPNIARASLYLPVSSPYANVVGTVSSSLVSCDMYGFNCARTVFNDNPNVTVATNPTFSTISPTAITLTGGSAGTVVYQSEVAIDLTLTNSTFSAGNIIHANPNIYEHIEGSFTWTDANNIIHHDAISIQPNITSTIDPYTGILSQVADGTAHASMGFKSSLNPPAAGSSITGTVTISETSYDSYTVSQSTTNYIDLGSNTFTVSNAPYVFTLNKLPASNTLAINMPIPAQFPPTPPTVLTVQNVVPPAGMVLSSINITDAYSYFDYMPHPTFPYVSASNTVQGTNLTLYTFATDPYTGASWDISKSFAKGTTVTLAATLTTPPSISPYQSGATIHYNLNSTATTTLTEVLLSDPASKATWSILLPATGTSITLPAIPASITSPWQATAAYKVSISKVSLGNLTYAQFLQELNANVTFTSFEIISSPQVPYTY